MPTVFLVDPASPGDGPLQRLFHGAGFHVVQLGSGDEAVAAMAALSPDLIVVDAAHPPAGATALAARLREDPRWQGLPLIVHNARPDDRRLCGLIGPDNVFVAGGATTLRDLLQHATRQLARLRPPASVSAAPQQPPIVSAG